MALLDVIREGAYRLFPRTAGVIMESRLKNLEDENFHLSESLTRLQLELENEGYARLTQFSDHEFDRKRLSDLIKLTVAMAIKNPLTGRAVNVQSDYVFGRGVKFVAAHPLVQSVIDEHTNYCRNQRVLYSHDAMSRQERELQVKGNLFFALVTNRRTGRVMVQDIDTDEIQEVFRDPDDYHTVWFYKRTWNNERGEIKIQYHPAIGITRSTPGLSLPNDSDKGEIIWDSPVYHAKFNYYGRMKFGIPEIYASLDWALAYKRFLEDWTSIMRSYARMAMKITGLSGKKQAAAAKGLLNTSITLSNAYEKNPSPATASTGLFGKGVDVEPVKTSGSTTPAKEGQPLINMVSAANGIPSTFFGDASVGNHATATTLDRPTELKMVARQRLWMSIFSVIFEYVIYCSAAAKLGGILAEAGATLTETVDPFTNMKTLTVNMPSNTDDRYGEVGIPISTKVETKFPELLERNVTDRVRALVNALTLFGKSLTDIVPDKRMVCTLLLDALNVPYTDSTINQFVVMWTKNMNAEPGEQVDPIIVPSAPPPGSGGFGAEDPSQGGDVGANG